jgi:hypothetical protein
MLFIVHYTSADFQSAIGEKAGWASLRFFCVGTSAARRVHLSEQEK